ALANREQFGIWCGTSERERRRLSRMSAAEKDVTLAS
ncbi:MAG: WhiB family transcriptional regulator, partial [Actinobacteria bacterium]|nr:WhiB family transcriptional regulator [Actinomycetota bacterium]